METRPTGLEREVDRGDVREAHEHGGPHVREGQVRQEPHAAVAAAGAEDGAGARIAGGRGRAPRGGGGRLRRGSDEPGRCRGVYWGEYRWAMRPRPASNPGRSKGPAGATTWTESRGRRRSGFCQRTGVFIAPRAGGDAGLRRGHGGKRPKPSSQALPCPERSSTAAKKASVPCRWGAQRKNPSWRHSGRSHPAPGGTGRKSGRWRRKPATRSWFSARFTVQVA